MNEGEFKNRLHHNRTYVHLWTSINNVNDSLVLNQIDDDFKLFKAMVDEARKEFESLYSDISEGRATMGEGLFRLSECHIKWFGEEES